MYNDEWPNGTSSETSAHAKGVVAMDGQSGFWLVHSIPRFPPSPAPGVNYTLPVTGLRYGQTMLCLSFGFDQADPIGRSCPISSSSVSFFTLPLTSAQWQKTPQVKDESAIGIPGGRSALLLKRKKGPIDWAKSQNPARAQRMMITSDAEWELFVLLYFFFRPKNDVNWFADCTFDCLFFSLNQTSFVGSTWYYDLVFSRSIVVAITRCASILEKRPTIKFPTITREISVQTPTILTWKSRSVNDSRHFVKDIDIVVTPLESIIPSWLTYFLYPIICLYFFLPTSGFSTKRSLCSANFRWIKFVMSKIARRFLFSCWSIWSLDKVIDQIKLWERKKKVFLSRMDTWKI